MPADKDDRAEFTDEQLRAALHRVGTTARQSAFQLGRPIVILRGALLVAVYPNGTEEVVEQLPQDNDAAANG